jgi:putative aldouronate transport system substrate-binding protein
MKRSIFSGILGLVMGAGFIFMGCGQQAKSADASGPDKLTIWAPLFWASKVTDHQENIAFQDYQKAANVQLVFQTPPVGLEQENFNLMIAGNTLPDLIMSGWSGTDMYTGGLDKFIDDGVIIRLNEMVEKYAPDYLKCINTFVPTDERKEFYTDKGNMAVFYAISPYEEWVYSSIVYRKDWLDDLGVENPETIEDVEKVLTLFRDKKGAKSPLIFPPQGVDGNSGIFVSAYGIGPGFYQKNGTVLYGPIQPEFKQYLTLMNDWYKKGLIDRDFPTRDEDAWKRMFTTGEGGAIIHSPDTMAAWLTGISPVVGGYYPVQRKGQRVQWRLKTFRARPPYCVAVTSACKNLEAAGRYLNYGYTEPGWMEANYGREGSTYIKTGEFFEINGVEFPSIDFTDTILHNPEYPNILDSLAKYKLHIGPFLRFEHQSNPVVAADKTAGEIRQFLTAAGDTSMVLPYISPTADEASEFSGIMNELYTFQTTAVLEFIMGKQSLNNFDQYVSTIKRLNIDRAIAIQQAALNRYNAR